MIYWREFLLPYNQAVDELKVKFKSIRDEYKSISEYSPIEFVTGRVKAVSSIIEKSKKNGYSEDEIATKVEDIAGIRIMCQFEDDIYKIVDLIKLRDGVDLEIVNEKNYIKNKKESGYRSYHIIIKYPVVSAKGIRLILAEIQIRTLAMNFWATVEHSINYKYKGNIPNELKEQLKTSAEAAYKLDKEMLSVRDEVIQAQKLFTIKSNIVTRIISNINMLESIGKKKEAQEYRRRFYDYSEKEHFNEIKDLSTEIKKTVDKYFSLD